MDEDKRCPNCNSYNTDRIEKKFCAGDDCDHEKRCCCECLATWTNVYGIVKKTDITLHRHRKATITIEYSNLDDMDVYLRRARIALLEDESLKDFDMVVELEINGEKK
jgi:hypothetical protein